MKPLAALLLVVSILACAAGSAAPTFATYSAAGSTVASITPTRDAFRVAIGGGTTAGANGSFGGLRREINWDGVPDTFADPNALPANFFNSNSPRGVVFSTPGTGFLVSSNAGASTPTLFGFPSDFQTFSAQRLFTAVNSNTTDVTFFVPGTTTMATTMAFGLIFVDVEVANQTSLSFFDENDALVYTGFAAVAGNQGLSFLGATVTGGSIARVRITSGLNTIRQNGLLGNQVDDIVVMDDFLYAEPLAAIRAIPEPGIAALVALGSLAMGARRRRRSC